MENANAIIINGIRHDFTHDEMEIVKGALWVYSQQAQYRASEMKEKYMVYGEEKYKRFAQIFNENSEIASDMAFDLI